MKQLFFTTILIVSCSIIFGQTAVELHLKETGREFIFSQSGSGSIQVINEQYNLTTYKGFEGSEKGSTVRKIIVRDNEMKTISKFEFDAWGAGNYPNEFITAIDQEKMDYYIFNFDRSDVNKKDLKKFNLKTGAKKELNIPELKNIKYKIRRVNNGVILGCLLDDEQWFTYNFDSKELKILPLQIYYHWSAISLHGKGYLLGLKGTKKKSNYYHVDKDFNSIREISLDECQNNHFIYPSSFLMEDNGDLVLAGYAKEMKKPDQNNSINKKGKRLQSSKYNSVFLTILTKDNKQTTSTISIKDIECAYYNKGTVTYNDNRIIEPKKSKVGKIQGDSYFHRTGNQLFKHNGNYVYSHGTMSKKLESSTSEATIKTGIAATSGETQYETTTTMGGYKHHEIYSYHFQKNGSLLKTVKIKQGYQDSANKSYRTSFSLASTSNGVVYILSSQYGYFYSVLNYDNNNFRSSVIGRCSLNSSKSSKCNELHDIPSIKHIGGNTFLFGISLQVKAEKGTNRYFYTGKFTVE